MLSDFERIYFKVDECFRFLKVIFFVYIVYKLNFIKILLCIILFKFVIFWEKIDYIYIKNKECVFERLRDFF